MQAGKATNGVTVDTVGAPRFVNVAMLAAAAAAAVFGLVPHPVVLVLAFGAMQFCSAGGWLVSDMGTEGCWCVSLYP